MRSHLFKISNKKEKSATNNLINSNQSKSDSLPIDYNERNSSFTKVGSNSQQATIHFIKKFSCTCEKSKCLKKYCECFANGETCSSSCQCFDCRNMNFNTHLATNKKEKDNITAPADNKSITCTCTKSNCIKNYCDCFKANKKCSLKCRCLDCQNTIFQSKHNKEQKQKLIIEFFRIEIHNKELKFKEGKVLFSKTPARAFSSDYKKCTESKGEEETLCNKKRFCS